MYSLSGIFHDSCWASRRRRGGRRAYFLPQRIELSPREIGAHLLCADCEDILAANESYAHQWITRKDRFPLLERLDGVTYTRRRTIERS